MKINDLTCEARDSYDRLKYNSALSARLNKIKKDLSLNEDLELLCNQYTSLNQELIKYNINDDPEIQKLKKETLQSLMAAGGAPYLSEEVIFNQQ